MWLQIAASLAMSWWHILSQLIRMILCFNPKFRLYLRQTGMRISFFFSFSVFEPFFLARDCRPGQLTTDSYANSQMTDVRNISVLWRVWLLRLYTGSQEGGPSVRQYGRADLHYRPTKGNGACLKIVQVSKDWREAYSLDLTVWLWSSVVTWKGTSKSFFCGSVSHAVVFWHYQNSHRMYK